MTNHVSVTALVGAISLVMLAGCVAGEAGRAPGPAAPATSTALVPLPVPTPRVLRRADRPASSAAAPTETQQLVAALPKVGSLAPDFTMRTLDGDSVTLSDLRGRPVVLNFWASWCPPCRDEAPALRAFYADHRAHGLVVLGVNVTAQDTVEAAQNFVVEFGLEYPIPLDEAGDVTDAYRVPGLPTTFLVDGDGIIRNVIMGPLSPADLRQGLALIKTW